MDGYGRATFTVTCRCPFLVFAAGYTDAKWFRVIKHRLHMKNPLRTMGNYLLEKTLGLVYLVELDFVRLGCPISKATENNVK